MLIRFRNRVWVLILAAGFIALCPTGTFGQMNTGEISGIVRDPTGAVIANSSIAAVETATALKYATRTNASGEFLLAQLPVGHYSVTVTADGFKQVVQPNVEVHAGDHLRQTFQLALGEQSETLTVSVAPG